MIENIFFSGWGDLLRTLIICSVAYPAMLVAVRLSGHRSLAQMNAFDLIVTIALGSILASVITSKDIALAQGLLAFGLLLGMQFLISWVSIRSSRFEQIINGEPVLLAYQGEMLPYALRSARVTEDEVNAMLRSSGLAGLKEVDAVVLETNGKISVVKRKSGIEPSALLAIPAYKHAATSNSG